MKKLIDQLNSENSTVHKEAFKKLIKCEEKDAEIYSYSNGDGNWKYHNTKEYWNDIFWRYYKVDKTIVEEETFYHTPGPWNVNAYMGEHDEAGAVIRSKSTQRICSTSEVLNQNWKEYHANAVLIAEAPEMLKELIKVKAEMDSPKHIDKSYWSKRIGLIIKRIKQS